METLNGPHTAWELARMAGCSDPDTSDSVGAKFLLMVEDTLKEYDDPDYDTAWEIADNAPSVYTYEMWQQFIDLGAFEVDISEHLPEITSMDQAARVALFIIAERLCIALIEENQE